MPLLTELAWRRRLRPIDMALLTELSKHTIPLKTPKNREGFSKSLYASEFHRLSCILRPPRLGPCRAVLVASLRFIGPQGRYGSLGSAALIGVMMLKYRAPLKHPVFSVFCQLARIGLMAIVSATAYLPSWKSRGKQGKLCHLPRPDILSILPIPTDPDPLRPPGLPPTSRFKKTCISP